ncbi:DUF3592 domain-containing protein [Microbulbifer yueqingensis]
MSLKVKLFLWLLLATALSAIYAYIVAGEFSINLLCGLVTVLGIWGLVYTTGSMRRSCSSYDWVPREYRVASSTVIFERGSSDGINHRYKPKYELEYEYGGKTYRRLNDDINLHLGELFATLHDATNHIERVRAGLYGRYLFVNPDNPAEAFVRRGITRDQIGTLVFCVIVIVLAFLTVTDLIEWLSHTTIIQ